MRIMAEPWRSSRIGASTSTARLTRVCARINGSMGGNGPENRRPVNAALPMDAEIAQHSVAPAISR